MYIVRFHHNYIPHTMSDNKAIVDKAAEQWHHREVENMITENNLNSDDDATMQEVSDHFAYEIVELSDKQVNHLNHHAPGLYPVK